METVRIEHPKGRTVILYVPGATAWTVRHPGTGSMLAVSGQGKELKVHGYAIGGTENKMDRFRDPEFVADLIRRNPLFEGATELHVLPLPNRNGIVFRPIPKSEGQKLRELLLARKPKP